MWLVKRCVVSEVVCLYMWLVKMWVSVVSEEV